MKTPTQPTWLLHWLAYLQACLSHMHHLWQSCCSWLATKPLTPPTRFKPWLSAVSRRAMHCDSGHWRSKPDWVRLAVFDLALGLPGAGYRTIAHCFNLQQTALQSQQATDSQTEMVTVSKTFVAKLLTSQRAALAQARYRARSRGQGRREPIQTTWGVDLTGLPLTDGSSVPVFGIIDHGSRAIVALEPVATYNRLILLGRLLIAMGTVSKPRVVRSDNDAVFKTWLFRAVLRFIGVRQQFTDLGSPWQNGRIERFWRTLKSELQTKAVRSRFNGQAIQIRMKCASVNAMRSLLDAFRFSYNAHRPHQSLGGATPATVWNGQVDAVRQKLKAKPTPAARSRARNARAPPA
jgi:putative transposase